MKNRNRTPDGHIRDFDKDHHQQSYQSLDSRQNLRQTKTHNTHNFGRDDIGFTGRDTRGYDRQHQKKY